MFKSVFAVNILLVFIIVALLPDTGLAQRTRQSERERIEEQAEEKTPPEKKVQPYREKSIPEGRQPRLEREVDPDRYILGPFDRLQISIEGTESKSFAVYVLPEGNIYLEGITSIQAAGKSLTEFRRDLRRAMLDYFHDIRVRCYLMVPRVFKVFVTGEVHRPGAVEVTAVDRVSDAIDKAGDIKSEGTTRRVQVIRGDSVINVDILKVIVLGELEKNVFLANGDAVHVPPTGKHVTIHGDILRGGVFEIVPGETIKDAIHLAGGMTGEAVTDSVLLSRVLSGDTVTTFGVSSDNYDMQLKDLDVISVLNRFNMAKRVFVFGAVTKTGRFFITEGEKLSNLLARVGRFADQADLRAVSIERSNREHIRVDLTKYLSNDLKEDDLKLKDGDKIHIPTVQKIVAVGGEVQNPGSFDYQGDLTVAHYVGLAGGPTEHGSLDRVVIYSTDGSMRSADKNTRPNRGDVIIVKKSGTRLIAEFFSGVIRLGTVVISIIVLSQ